VKSIGLTPLLCGNIKGLQDRYRNPTTQADAQAILIMTRWPEFKDLPKIVAGREPPAPSDRCTADAG
jgi:hypothetical protein